MIQSCISLQFLLLILKWKTAGIRKILLMPFPISESAVKLNSASITFVKPAGYTYLFGFGKHCVKLDAIIKNSGDATGSTM